MNLGAQWRVTGKGVLREGITYEECLAAPMMAMMAATIHVGGSETPKEDGRILGVIKVVGQGGDVMGNVSVSGDRMEERQVWPIYGASAAWGGLRSDAQRRWCPTCEEWEYWVGVEEEGKKKRVVRGQVTGLCYPRNLASG